MDVSPGLFAIWMFFGVLVGSAMFFMFGGNLYVHMLIGIVASIIGGLFVMKNRKNS